MNLFDDSFSLWRWQGDGPLPLQTVGHDAKLRQLKEEFEQVERPLPVWARPPRHRLASFGNRRRSSLD